MIQITRRADWEEQWLRNSMLFKAPELWLSKPPPQLPPSPVTMPLDRRISSATFANSTLSGRERLRIFHSEPQQRDSSTTRSACSAAATSSTQGLHSWQLRFLTFTRVPLGDILYLRQMRHPILLSSLSQSRRLTLPRRPRFLSTWSCIRPVAHNCSGWTKITSV